MTSENLDYDDLDDTDTEQPAPDRNPLRAQMKRMEKELKALREEAATGKQATRALEFAKAGVSLDDPKAKWFLKGYDGDLTAEAIKTAAVEAGLIEATTPADDIPAEEKAAHARQTAVQVGGATPGSHGIDEQIAAATAAGNHLAAIALKQQRAATNRAKH
jgi:hypothetical protein